MFTALAIWQIIQKFGDAFDMSSIQDITKNPSMIGDSIPFMVATYPLANRTGLSWDMDETINWCTFTGKACQLK